MRPNIDIVVGLGFGDEGKGICTDILCSQYCVDDTIVVRYNGGQQAGHNVVINKLSHIHSNFGSGTLRGFASYISKYCTFYPATMLNEFNVLKKKNVDPLLFIDPLAILTTPYDVIYNRFIEKINLHGSCGLGIGTTMKRHNESGYKLFAIDIKNRTTLSIKLANILSYYISLLKKEKYDSDKLAEFASACDKEQTAFLNALEVLFYTPLSQIKINKIDGQGYKNIIFEGAQGIMLDMDHGFFPNVTYSNCTSKNAIQLCNDWNLENHQKNVWYVTRCYQTRHGYGPMTSDQSPIKLVNNEKETNVFNEWQTDFRVGELDYNLLNYAINVDDIYTNYSCVKNLLVTCNDQRPDMEFDFNKISNKIHNNYKSYSPNTNDFKFESAACDEGD